MQKRKKLLTKNAMRRIQRILNLKGVKNIEYTFRYVEKMNVDTARLIKEVV